MSSDHWEDATNGRHGFPTGAPALRVVSDADAEMTRLRLIACAAIDLLDCIDQRTAAGWHKVPRREVEALRAAVNGEIHA